MAPRRTCCRRGWTPACTTTVVSEAVVLAGEQPWRERRWELLALAQYRCGRQRDALASIRTARRALGDELGLDPGSGLVELERAILAQDPRWRRTTTPARRAARVRGWAGVRTTPRTATRSSVARRTSRRASAGSTTARCSCSSVRPGAASRR